MWKVLEHPAWKSYKEIAAIRGLLYWVGGSGVAMALLTMLGSFLLAGFQSVPGTWRFAVGIAGLIAVGLLFAVVRLLFGKDPPPPEPKPGKVIDARGVRYTPPVPSRSRKRQWSRFVAGTLTVVSAIFTYTTGTLAKLAARLSPEPATALFMECSMTSLPLPVPQGESLRVIGLNKARGKKQNWGFFEVYGDRDAYGLPRT